MRLAIRLVLTAAILGIILWLTDVTELARTLAGASVGLVLAGVAMTLVAVLITSWKWKLLLDAHRLQFSFAALVRLNFISMTYSLVLPGQLAGEAVKTIRLVQGRRDRGTLAASVLVDRVTGLIGLLILGLFGLWFSASDVSRGIVTSMLLGTALVVVALLAMLCIDLDPVLRGTNRRGLIGRVLLVISRVASGVRSYRTMPVTLLVSCVIGVAFQSLLTASTWTFARSLDVDVSYADLSWVLAIVVIVQLAPITVAGIGTREGAVLALLGTLGVARHDALSISILIFMTLVVQAIVGAICESLPVESRRRHQTR